MINAIYEQFLEQDETSAPELGELYVTITAAIQDYAAALSEHEFMQGYNYALKTRGKDEKTKV